MSICIGISRLRERRVESNPHTLGLRVFLDALNLDRGGLKLNAVRFSGEFADLADQRPNVLQLVVGLSGQVNVHRGPGDRRLPSRQEEGSLQYEPIREW
jgi:hypothetical protein